MSFASGWLLPSVNKPVAVKATDSPAKAVGAAGATVSDSTSGAVTTTWAVALVLLNEAVMVAWPWV